MFRPCPECGDSLSASNVCGSCGYGKTATKGKTFDPDWWKCASVDRGQRCGKPGVMSHSTHGGGPWYCAPHFSPNFAERAKGRPAIRELRAVLPDREALEERAAIQADGA